MVVNGTPPGNPSIDDRPNPLKIAVVGAGIGGICVAIALRRQGHEVELYEQSRSASEIGAAVHLSPNANGILRRWGLLAETFGANNADGLVERRSTGEVIRDVDLTTPNKMWQHPWQLVHRVALHNKLKETATSKSEPGIPAVIRNANKAVSVDADAGVVTLEDGTSIAADVVIGADGVYSRMRRFAHGKQPRLFSSGKAAFRFLLQKKIALEDPLTAPLVEKDNVLTMWYGADRRVVMYPCNHNETLNLVCIHPDSESHATQSDAWDKQGSIEQVLRVFEDFDPALKQLISKVDESELKVWQLLDMEKLPSWTRTRLALLGDAAHPFTPHQGQGAGQAIEDAAALGTVLPKGTRPSDVPERLQLYEKIRYERAHVIQEYSRQAGRDWVNGKPQIDMMSYTAYNFGHDEIDNSSNLFKRWLRSKNPSLRWRMPLSFGPAAPPPPPPCASKRALVTASVKFKTSRTYLETLFPTDSFRFRSPATICTASISATTFGNVSCAGGEGDYNRCGLYIHGVEYARQDGSSVVGTYLAVSLGDVADPILSGPDELGMGRVHCHIDVTRKPDSYRLVTSWGGFQFLDLGVDSLVADDPDTGEAAGAVGGEEEDFDILTYRYVPAVGQPGKADVAYACVVPRARVPEVNSVQRSTDATIAFDAGDWETLPTLHHVASGLAGMPIYDIVGAKVVEGLGEPAVATCRRIE
ncbi:hypothetical protein F4823DRAFT_623271 [Ustulina deusta]|nr:hypothetical protein F4823DRAFT_623271 [Ustulina deusta]